MPFLQNFSCERLDWKMKTGELQPALNPDCPGDKLSVLPQNQNIRASIIFNWLYNTNIEPRNFHYISNG